MKSEHVFIIGVISVLVIAIAIAYFFPNPNNAYNKACIDLGHNKATDFNRDSCGYGRYSISLECDRKAIYHFEETKFCEGYNKWGECSTSGIKLNLANYSC